MKKRTLALTLALLLLVSLPGGALAATLKASADPAAMPQEGNAKISVSVTNTSEVAMEGLVISNPNMIMFDTAGVVITPGESKVFSSAVTIPASLLGQPLSFDLTWTENGEAKTGSTSVTIIKGSASGISLKRTASTTQASPGETVRLSYTVVNIGIVELQKISMIDAEIGGKTTQLFKEITLAPGESYVYDHAYTMGYETVKSAPVLTYTPTGLSAPQTYDAIEPLQLGMVNTKLQVEVQQGMNTAEGVTFTLLVTNTGNQKLRNIKIKDELGQSVSDSFSLAVGEGKMLTYKVSSEAERNVYFSFNAATDAGQGYEDKTKSFVVRKYIDPSLLGVDFKAEVVEMLNAAGSIKVKFTFLNTGEMEMKNLVLSEKLAGELYRLESFPTGEHATEQTLYVGEPRDLAFTLEVTDPAGNPYSYAANITAGFLGTGFLGTGDAQEPIFDEPADPGSSSGSIGDSVSSALRTALFVLGALTVVALIALVVLTVLERKERERALRQKRKRERLLREQQAAVQQTNLDETLVTKRRPPQE